MANFFRDYWALCKESWGFWSDHWLGTLILSISFGLIVFLIEYTIIEPKWPAALWEKVKCVFSRG